MEKPRRLLQKFEVRFFKDCKVHARGRFGSIGENLGLLVGSVHTFFEQRSQDFSIRVVLFWLIFVRVVLITLSISTLSKYGFRIKNGGPDSEGLRVSRLSQ